VERSTLRRAEMFTHADTYPAQPGGWQVTAVSRGAPPGRGHGHAGLRVRVGPPPSAGRGRGSHRGLPRGEHRKIAGAQQPRPSRL